MPSPKHLWSGDWQDESAAAAARRRPAEPALEPAPVEADPASRRWRNWRLSAAALLAVLLLAAIAVALLTPGGSKRSGGATTSLAQAQPGTGGGVFTPPGVVPQGNPGSGPSGSSGTAQTSGATSGTWLGVEVASTPSGVLIEGIVAGGPADAAALRPGDVLLAVGRQPIRSLRDLTAVLAGLRPGQTVDMHVRRGGATITRPLTVGQSPSASAASP
jgi:S1-C subfamily serine protease